LLFGKKGAGQEKEFSSPAPFFPPLSALSAKDWTTLAFLRPYHKDRQINPLHEEELAYPSVYRPQGKGLIKPHYP
jgi:hypothetical protein